MPSGHSDVVMGLVSVNDSALYERLKFLQYGKYKSDIESSKWAEAC